VTDEEDRPEMAVLARTTRRPAAERAVRTFLPLAGPSSALAAAFCADPGRWLPDARADGQTWVLRLRAGALSRGVRATVGAPWQVGATHWRTVSWDPLPARREALAIDRLLPSLDGELGLHLDTTGRVTLVLDARYRAPGGALGAAIDAVALHRVARETVERLLEEVGARLSAEAQHLEVTSDTGDTAD